jgi:anti-sigma-K factor RskA
MSEDRFDELLGPYLLRQLTAEEQQELEHHLEECFRCRDELDRIQQTHTRLREFAANEPPAELKTQTMARIRRETMTRIGVRWKGWAPAAAALLLVAILGIGLFQPIIGDSSEELQLTATPLAPGASGVLQGEKVGENIQFELDVRGLPKLQKDEYYEMWYAKENGERISCGTFRAQPGGLTTLNLTAPVNAASYPKVEVTREPDNGDPGASGEKILVGNLRSI